MFSKIKKSPLQEGIMFNNKLKNIDINKIQANENQPRTVF